MQIIDEYEYDRMTERVRPHVSKPCQQCKYMRAAVRDDSFHAHGPDGHTQKYDCVNWYGYCMENDFDIDDDEIKNCRLIIDRMDELKLSDQCRKCKDLVIEDYDIIYCDTRTCDTYKTWME